MCEITNKNFEEKYPEIIESLRSADFLSIDCEFSGLFDTRFRNSFFDSAKQQFDKKQKSLENYCIVQFGLSVFNFDRDTNNFSASSYSFYLLPFVNHKKASKLTWQLTSADFLCKYKFDFNKVFYDGISYLNKTNEAAILDKINNGTISSIFNDDDFQEVYGKIWKWSKLTPEGEESLLKLKGKQLALKYVIQFETRKSIENVWVSDQGANVIKMKKISRNEKLVLLSDKKEEAALKKKIFDSIVGFSKIIHEIERLQKPLIGHNLLLDLILIYQQFYNPTHVSYSEFKEKIHKIFPCIYDTKVVCSGLQMKIPREECWISSSLCDLYTYFRKGTGAKKIILSPIISSRENYSNLKKFHDAGFDSFCTGYCFVKMAYMMLLWDEKNKNFSATTVSKTVTSLLAAVENMSNCLHIPRSPIKWIALNGRDPERAPPVLLVIKPKGNHMLNLSQISEKLSSQYYVSLKLLNRYSGVIAVNKKHVNYIQNYFASNEFIVTKYSFLRHSFWGKTIVGSLFASAVLGVILTLKVLRLSKFIRLH